MEPSCLSLSLSLSLSRQDILALVHRKNRPKNLRYFFSGDAEESFHNHPARIHIPPDYPQNSHRFDSDRLPAINQPLNCFEFLIN